jgi:hypothetical protein
MFGKRAARMETHMQLQQAVAPAGASHGVTPGDAAGQQRRQELSLPIGHDRPAARRKDDPPYGLGQLLDLLDRDLKNIGVPRLSHHSPPCTVCVRHNCMMSAGPLKTATFRKDDGPVEE